MNRHQLLIIGCLLLFQMCKSSKTYSPDEALIRKTREEFNTAIAHHDSTRVSAFCTKDYTAISSRNFEIKGQDGETTALATEFRTRKEVLYVRSSKVIEINLTWNMASESGSWTGQWREPDGLVKLSGSYYAKWHKVDGQWKIRAEVFTPLTCAGSKFCDQAPSLN